LSANRVPIETLVGFGLVNEKGSESKPALYARAWRAGDDRVVLLLVAALDARLLQQLAVLLLGHPLTPLLDDRTHYPTSLAVNSLRSSLANSLDAHSPRTIDTRESHGARVTERRAYPGSARLEERTLQVVLHGFLGYPERPSYPNGGQLAGVHHSVHRHLRDAHYPGHLGDRQKAHLAQPIIGLSHASPCFRHVTVSRLPLRQPDTHVLG